MLFFGRLDAEKGWTKQLHLGALRNNNTRGFRELGPDTGFDSIGDWPQADALAAYLDRLDQEEALPKTIVYNLNPADNYVLATMVGNFQDGRIAGKMQFGSGWWFLDQKEAMEWQINALSNVGLLSRFVGMLTDSRSFMSYPRHEYFRRVLCNLIGRDIENGEIPNDEALVGPDDPQYLLPERAPALGAGSLTRPQLHRVVSQYVGQAPGLRRPLRPPVTASLQSPPPRAWPSSSHSDTRRAALRPPAAPSGGPPCRDR